MVEVSLALIIGSLAAAAALSQNIRATKMTSADLDADVLGMYQKALQSYVDDGYPQLQQNLTPTRNAVSPADRWSPTTAELIGMGYLGPGFTGVLNNVDAAPLRNTITRLPVACAPVDCAVVGVAWVDAPFYRRGTVTVDNLVVGQMLTKLGVIAGSSFEDAPAVIVGAGGSWTEVNPVAAQPPGVVAVRFGANASVLATFLRMNDVRDPNFQNNVTIAGGVIVAGPSTINNTLGVTGAATLGSTLAVTGAATLNGGLTVNGASTLNGTAAATGQISSQTAVGASDTGLCLRAALEANGGLVTRAADCLERARVDNAGLTTRDAGGIVRGTFDTAGGLSLRNGVGATTVSADAVSGRLTAQTISVQTVSVSGGICTTAGDISIDSAASGTVLVCRGGVWRRPGLEEALLNGGCATAGQLAQTSSNETLICRGGTWRLLNDRVSSMVAMDIWSGNGSGNVPSPTCGFGGVPDIAVSALQGGADYGGMPPRNRFEFRVTGGGPWSVDPVMVDSTGSAFSAGYSSVNYNLGWTAVTYCRYAV